MTVQKANLWVSFRDRLYFSDKLYEYLISLSPSATTDIPVRVAPIKDDLDKQSRADLIRSKPG